AAAPQGRFDRARTGEPGLRDANLRARSRQHPGPAGGAAAALLVFRRPIGRRHDPGARAAQLTHRADVDHAIPVDPDGMGTVTPQVEPIDDDRRMRARNAHGLDADDHIGALALFGQRRRLLDQRYDLTGGGVEAAEAVAGEPAAGAVAVLRPG